MFIIPYLSIHPTNLTAEPPAEVVWVFLSNGGKAVWETDALSEKPDSSEIVATYLTPNGIHGKVTKFTPDYLLYEVDRTTTNLKNFYSWYDTNHGDDVWRPFTWIGSADDEWKWAEATRRISLGKFGTVETLFAALKSGRS